MPQGRAPWRKGERHGVKRGAIRRARILNAAFRTANRGEDRGAARCAAREDDARVGLIETRPTDPGKHVGAVGMTLRTTAPSHNEIRPEPKPFRLISTGAPFVGVRGFGGT